MVSVTAAPAAASPLRYLALLSRKGASSRPVADDVRAMAVLLADGRLIGRVPLAAHAAVAGQGWCAEEADGQWAITARGRKHLKRRLSTQSERAAPAEPPGKPARVQVNDGESALSWLRRRKLVTDEQADAGERFRADFHAGHMAPRVTTNWSDPLGGGGGNGSWRGLEFSERVSASQERARRAMTAVGPELCGILVDVCGRLEKLEDVERSRGWPQRSAKLVLQMALTSLARHYGMVRRPSGNPVRHWGTGDYRPEATGEATS